MNVIVPNNPLRVQEVQWIKYKQSEYYNFICESSIAVCKLIDNTIVPYEVLKQLDYSAMMEEGYFFIVLYNNTPVGIVSAYIGEESYSTEKVFTEQFLYVLDTIPPAQSMSVLNLMFRTLEQKTQDLGIDSLCISCTNKMSMEKYIRILLKKGFNIETVTCRKRMGDGLSKKDC